MGGGVHIIVKWKGFHKNIKTMLSRLAILPCIHKWKGRIRSTKTTIQGNRKEEECWESQETRQVEKDKSDLSSNVGSHICGDFLASWTEECRASLKV